MSITAAEASALYLRSKYPPEGAVLKRDEARKLEDLGYEEWLNTVFPGHFDCKFLPEHHEFWQWGWKFLIALRDRKPLPPDANAFLDLLSRGYGKSFHCEMFMVASVCVVSYGIFLYVSGSQELANDHLANIELLLRSDGVTTWYPEHSRPKKGISGASRGWTQRKLETEGGARVQAIGLLVGVRGIRQGKERVRGFCHAKGTPILTDGQWMKVEDHPSAGARKDAGLQVEIFGVPFGETVTTEHRYWGISKRRSNNVYFWKKPGWIEAKDLTVESYIGLPIDTSVRPLEPIEYKTKGKSEHKIPPEFYDPDWWWLFGLWWGDGHLGGTNPEIVGWTIADKDTAVMDRVTTTLRKWGKKYWVTPKIGCSQVTIVRAPFYRWLKTWKVSTRVAQKAPPPWVENIDTVYQRALIQGYVAADGFLDKKCQAVRVTSVSLAGLLSMRRMLLRLGVHCSIRKGIDARENVEINGYNCRTQRKYDLYFRQNCETLGYPFKNQTRYKFTQVFIQDGWLWSKVKSIQSASEQEFVPIATKSHDYLTAFGRSHNCLDDVDDYDDSPAIALKKANTLASSVLPTSDTSFFVIGAQNLITEHSVFHRIYTKQDMMLAHRIVCGPLKAFENLDTEFRDGRDMIIGGDSNWPERVTWEVGQRFIDTYGLIRFMAEFQHDFSSSKQGLCLENYDDQAHIITRTEFYSMFGVREVPTRWYKYQAHDHARTKTVFHANVMLTLAVSSMNERFPGFFFIDKPMSFPAQTEADEVALRFLKSVTPTVTINGQTRMWDELVSSSLHRTNIDSYSHDVTKMIRMRRATLAKIIPPAVGPLLAQRNYRMFRMSHEQNLAAGKVYRDVYGIPAQPSNPGAEGGLELFNHFLAVDYNAAHPCVTPSEERIQLVMKRESCTYDEALAVISNGIGPGGAGFTRTLIIVEDGELEYTAEVSPERLHDSALLRYQWQHWRYTKPTLNDKGEKEWGPQKMNDDYGNCAMFLFHDTVPQAAPLNHGELVQEYMPVPLKNETIEAEVDPEKAVKLKMAQLMKLKGIEKQLQKRPSRNLVGAYRKFSKGR